MTYSDYVIFVDESGDDGLASIDRDYPVFVLDFYIFRKDHYGTAVVPKIQCSHFRRIHPFGLVGPAKKFKALRLYCIVDCNSTEEEEEN